MPVLRFPCVPTRFASGGRWPVTIWGSRTVSAPGASTFPSTISLAARPLPPLSPTLGALLAVACLSVPTSATSGRQRHVDSINGGAALPPPA